MFGIIIYHFRTSALIAERLNLPIGRINHLSGHFALTVHILGLFRHSLTEFTSSFSVWQAATPPALSVYRRRISYSAKLQVRYISQRDRSPYHHRTPPICTCQYSGPIIGQKFTDLLLLFLFLLLRRLSSGSTTSTASTRSRGGTNNSATTTRRNLSSHVMAISRHTMHTRTDESFADPSAINYVPSSVSKPSYLRFNLTYSVDIFSLELRDQLLEALVIGLDANCIEDLFDIAGRRGGVAADLKEEVCRNMTHLLGCLDQISPTKSRKHPLYLVTSFERVDKSTGSHKSLK